MSDPVAAAASSLDAIEPEPSVAAAVFGDRLPLAQRYASLLVDVGIPRGLLGPREAGRVWSRHVLNSALLASALPASVRTVADVGSGAGLPGIPLALARPDLRLTLIEPMQRRVDFLIECVETLRLDVEVVRVRAQDYEGPRVDAAAIRAVAPLEQLLEMAPHVIHPGGVLVALKGRSAAGEIAAASRIARKVGVRLEALPLAANPEGVVVRATWGGK